MRVTESSITFTAEEIAAAAEPDARPTVDPNRTPVAWFVEYEVFSFVFCCSYTFRHRYTTESEAREHMADHVLAETIRVVPAYA